MIRLRPLRVALLFGLPSFFVASPSAAEESVTADANSLAPFERLIGGEWHIEGSYQTFHWGPGKRSVVAKGYFVVQDEPRLVSEGFWYWHPEEKAIRGVFVATGMGIDLFEYATRFEGDTMRSEIRTFGPDGSSQTYRESWAFLDEDRYEWKLVAETPEGPKESMGATYERRR